MQEAVIDTNVIISAALTEGGNPDKIFKMALNGNLKMYYSAEILAEYIEVLSRPKLDITAEEQVSIIEAVEEVGELFAPSDSGVILTDKKDKKFYDLAKASGALLITGNIKHYPAESFVITPADFLRELET